MYSGSVKNTQFFPFARLPFLYLRTGPFRPTLLNPTERVVDSTGLIQPVRFDCNLPALSASYFRKAGVKKGADAFCAQMAAVDVLLEHRSDAPVQFSLVPRELLEMYRVFCFFAF